MTDRKDVYEAIDSERAYQDVRWAPEIEGGTRNHSVTEWLVYIQDYAAEALHKLSREADPQASQDALNWVRKIGGMAVACMEQNGAPRREGF